MKGEDNYVLAYIEVFLMNHCQMLSGKLVCIYVRTVQSKILAGENFGKFGKTNIILQYFTQPNSRFTKVANVSYCKFTNIFLAKTLKRLIRQSFTPSKFWAIWYIRQQLLSTLLDLFWLLIMHMCICYSYQLINLTELTAVKKEIYFAST